MGAESQADASNSDSTKDARYEELEKKAATREAELSTEVSRLQARDKVASRLEEVFGMDLEAAVDTLIKGGKPPSAAPAPPLVKVKKEPVDSDAEAAPMKPPTATQQKKIEKLEAEVA